MPTALLAAQPRVFTLACCERRAFIGQSRQSKASKADSGVGMNQAEQKQVLKVGAMGGMVRMCRIMPLQQLCCCALKACILPVYML